MTAHDAVFAVTRTKRRRFLWCAWWTGAPTRDPFRKPDAWGGGARTAEEARDEAERAAGQPLREIESPWAGAWVRVQAGLPPWFVRAARTGDAAPKAFADSVYAVLGVAPSATLADIKRAFRQRALEHHPDRGGDTQAFLRVKAAYDTILARREKRAKLKRSRSRR